MYYNSNMTSEIYIGFNIWYRFRFLIQILGSVQNHDQRYVHFHTHHHIEVVKLLNSIYSLKSACTY